MTLGLLAGTVVAQATYGRIDFLDPKIMLSILMWVVYLLLLYTRWSAGWRGTPRGLPCGRGLRHGTSGLGGKLFQYDSQICTIMNFQLIGINHTTAPVEVRERLAIPESRLADALKQLRQHPGVDEGLILCTCNRSKCWRKLATAARTCVLFCATTSTLTLPAMSRTCTSIAKPKPFATCFG